MRSRQQTIAIILSKFKKKMGKRTSFASESEVIVRPASGNEEGHTVLRVGNTHVYISDHDMTGEALGLKDGLMQYRLDPGRAANISIVRHAVTPAGDTNWTYDKVPDPVETRRALMATVRYLRENGYTHITANAVNPGITTMLTRAGATLDSNGYRQWLPLAALKKVK
jgi:hypothetical protein